MSHNKNMKILMPVLLAVVGVFVIVGVIALKRTSPGIVTSKDSIVQQEPKSVLNTVSPGAGQNSESFGSVSPAKSAENPGITLAISSPVEGTTVKSASLTVRGVSTPGADVSVNETDTTADKSGNFTATVTLDEGENILIFVASDTDGNYAEKEVSVTYDTGVTY